jgi:hypothetical protein
VTLNNVPVAAVGNEYVDRAENACFSIHWPLKYVYIVQQSERGPLNGGAGRAASAGLEGNLVCRLA